MGSIRYRPEIGPISPRIPPEQIPTERARFHKNVEGSLWILGSGPRLTLPEAEIMALIATLRPPGPGRGLGSYMARLMTWPPLYSHNSGASNPREGPWMWIGPVSSSGCPEELCDFWFRSGASGPEIVDLLGV